MTRNQLFEYLLSELDKHTRGKYSNNLLARTYQTGLLLRVITELCIADSKNYEHVRRVLKKLH